MVIGVISHGRRHEKPRRWNHIGTGIEIQNDGLRNLKRRASKFTLLPVVFFRCRRWQIRRFRQNSGCTLFEQGMHPNGALLLLIDCYFHKGRMQLQNPPTIDDHSPNALSARQHLMRAT